jgi:hypothetical protein
MQEFRGGQAVFSSTNTNTHFEVKNFDHKKTRYSPFKAVNFVILQKVYGLT